MGGWGNYLPGLHQLLQGCRPGDSIKNISVDAGWGSRRDDMIFEVQEAKLRDILKQQQQHKNSTTTSNSSSIVLEEGKSLTLPGDIQVFIKEIRSQDSTVILDANHPLAGSSYSCSFDVLTIESFSKDLIEYNVDEKADLRTSASQQSRYEIATFALGCFWGAELAFLRVPGVVGTQAGYSQGTTKCPTYEEVSKGKTKHREAVMVIYDASVLSYAELMHVAVDRLEQTVPEMALHQLFHHEEDDDDDDHFQYKHGFYYHTDNQQFEAEEFLKISKNVRFGIEVIPSKTFYKAEEYHQQYLFKGGQCAKKGCTDTIRCFG